MSDHTPENHDTHDTYDDTLYYEPPESPGSTGTTGSTVPEQSGRHPVNIGHLVMGIAFLGLTLVWALYESGTVQGEDLRWFMPVPWLAAGLAGLAAVAWGQRRTSG